MGVNKTAYDCPEEVTRPVPTICPLSLIPRGVCDDPACAEESSNEFRSVIVEPLYRKAWSPPPAIVEYPTICAAIDVERKSVGTGGDVPRSVIVESL